MMLNLRSLFEMDNVILLCDVVQKQQAQGWDERDTDKSRIYGLRQEYRSGCSGGNGWIFNRAANEGKA